MTKFNKGDRVVFVKDDVYGGVEMPKGTLATYDNVDDPATPNPAPWVKLDTGERVRAWLDHITHAEDHGTGDGSASDICAEPGCNCDLERRFPAPRDPGWVRLDTGERVFETPAPLDPAAVKPGDMAEALEEGRDQYKAGAQELGAYLIDVTAKIALLREMVHAWDTRSADSGKSPDGLISDIREVLA